jgi:hypothetical protein
MIALTSLVLCDAATVREGLLNVLAAGITSLSRPEFPGPMSVSVAMIFTLDGETAENIEYPISVVIENTDTREEILAADVGLSLVRRADAKAAPQSVPIVGDFSAVEIPAAGSYAVRVNHENRELGRLRFEAVTV